MGYYLLTQRVKPQHKLAETSVFEVRHADLRSELLYLIGAILMLTVCIKFVVSMRLYKNRMDFIKSLAPLVLPFLLLAYGHSVFEIYILYEGEKTL